MADEWAEMVMYGGSIDGFCVRYYGHYMSIMVNEGYWRRQIKYH